jgi:small ligand-binding sensory domain FIST
MQLDDIRYRIGAVRHLDKNEKLAGKKLGEKLSREPEDKVLLILYHSLKHPESSDAPPVLNSSSLLIEGIGQRLRSKVPIVGAGVVADFDFSSPIKQFCGSFVGEQMVAGVVLSGNITPYFAVMHGCSPLDGIYHRITKKTDSVIYELDDKPIVQVLDELFGNRDWRDQKPLRQLTMGINKGKRFEEPKEGNYVNRLITGVLPDGKGIGLFEPDLEQGCEVQFMLKDTGKMMESAKENCENLMAKIRADHKKALFGIYIDCAGRTAAYSNIETEEASEVQKVFNRYDTPLFGFYSGVEIAPFFGKSSGLDWTGVLMVMAGE